MWLVVKDSCIRIYKWLVMPVEQRYPTIEDLLQYEEFLLSAVEKQVLAEVNPRAKAILHSLQVLLKSRAVKAFIDLLSQKKFSLSSFQKIQEIDDSLDELRVMSFNLPYPEERFIIDQNKTDRNRRNVMTILLFGLFGFEWVN